MDLPAYVSDENENPVVEDATAKRRISLIPILSSQKAAKVLLKYWSNKYGRTADAVVIEGPKAGGHLGFQESRLESMVKEDYKSYEAEIGKILETIRE